jgi:hypothetical protein
VYRTKGGQSWCPLRIAAIAAALIFLLVRHIVWVFHSMERRRFVLAIDTSPLLPTTLHTFHLMNMYILSEAQFDQVIKALDAARFALDTCQHVELDLTNPEQTIPLPAGEQVVRTKAVRQSQSKTRKSSRKGRRGVSVLTDVKVLEIKRQLAAGGKSVGKIAKEFGVHPTTINCIKWNKTWKHVQLQQETVEAAA